MHGKSFILEIDLHAKSFDLGETLFQIPGKLLLAT
jgi:hypothetical protein